jgi:hypothetical protein
MTALDQLINLLRHWDKHNRETFCGIRVHEALQELETDAKLGRLVREMPEGASLHHNSNGYDEWSYEIGGRRIWEPTPEGALGGVARERREVLK